jgi:hypothetical protein
MGPYILLTPPTWSPAQFTPGPGPHSITVQRLYSYYHRWRQVRGAQGRSIAGNGRPGARKGGPGAGTGGPSAGAALEGGRPLPTAAFVLPRMMVENGLPPCWSSCCPDPCLSFRCPELVHLLAPLLARLTRARRRRLGGAHDDASGCGAPAAAAAAVGAGDHDARVAAGAGGAHPSGSEGEGGDQR